MHACIGLANPVAVASLFLPRVHGCSRAMSAAWGGNAQLWWIEARPGDRLTLPLETPAAGAYELIGFFTRSNDYGIVRLHVNGQTLKPIVDGYHATFAPSGPVSFGRVRLRGGGNELMIELLGKDPRSGGYRTGISSALMVSFCAEHDRFATTMASHDNRQWMSRGSGRCRRCA